eukprot:13994496-Ditylum_brightwellii.AAC.1
MKKHPCPHHESFQGQTMTSITSCHFKSNASNAGSIGIKEQAKGMSQKEQHPMEQRAKQNTTNNTTTTSPATTHLSSSSSSSAI